MRLIAASALALSASAAMAQSPQDVAATYVDIAEAAYADAVDGAEALQAAVEALIAEPSEETLSAARAAWVASRPAYMQTEVFRFGNPIVDDWEGKVNAWPLDEGLIDYVDASYFGGAENSFADLNVIASESFTLNGEEVDAAEITPALLEETLQEAGGNEANVATGYHAVEFLLWGQDLTADADSAGDRPWTDFAAGEACTGGNCERRAEYLSTATDLLLSDLSWMAGQWEEGGEARAAVMEDSAPAVRILTGMGSLAYGEMAGERIKLGLLLQDPEEEHDCFSDNTPASHYGDVLGIANVWYGTYTGPDGEVVDGTGLGELVSAADAELAATFETQLEAALASADDLVARASGDSAYDMMLVQVDEEGNAVIAQLVEDLVAMSQSIERMSGVLDVEGVVMEGSDALDDEAAVFE
ncbi:imelysin family protein [Pseudoroseicyclus tamaricis]|uniref:Peptidase n=1 Tax=Pseudoroseicyclus tamaricis TaxID=2705421 RepID=A0A6B2JI50_9RHOB|nr:imelysin family protein [Pseudoroseicyclus tamaricis]NDV01023.1 peptidase [Pseudoroseicyclus tamaricis]